MNFKFRMVVVITLAMLFFVSGCFEENVKRVGSVIGIPKKNIEQYKELSANTWPEVIKTLNKANVGNYSIYLGDVEEQERYYLFSYFEYTGDEYGKDMARIGRDMTTRRWWAKTDPLQKPLPTRKEGEWWAEWEEVFHFGGPAYEKRQITSRHGGIIGLTEETLFAYKQLHSAVWPDVLKAIEKSNIRNYSIYLGQLTPGEYVLFSYFEYIGHDFEADMKLIAEDAATQTWWKYTDPLQTRLPGTPDGDQWKAVPEVFHCE